MSRSTLAAIAATLSLSSPVLAASLQTSYTVNAKALKTAISGTVLTFGLYADATCTTAVSTAKVNVDDVDLIERVKRIKPTGGIKPPNTARLVPIGGECQLQYTSNAGTTLPGA